MNAVGQRQVRAALLDKPCQAPLRAATIEPLDMVVSRLRDQETKPLEKVMHQLAYIVGLVGPAAALPQILKIWSHHDDAGVSGWATAGYTTIAAIWLAYGVTLKQGPIVLSSTLWVILDLTICYGILRYTQ